MSSLAVSEVLAGRISDEGSVFGILFRVFCGRNPWTDKVPTRMLSTHMDTERDAKSSWDMVLIASWRAKKRWLYLMRVVVSPGARWMVMSMGESGGEEMASAKGGENIGSFQP